MKKFTANIGNHFIRLEDITYFKIDNLSDWSLEIYLRNGTSISIRSNQKRVSDRYDEIHQYANLLLAALNEENQKA